MLEKLVETSPAVALRMFFTLKPIRSRLMTALSPAQLEWLSWNIQTKPSDLSEFFSSTTGQQELLRLFNTYRQFNEAPASLELSEQIIPRKAQA